MRSSDKEKFSLAMGEVLYNLRDRANMANMTYIENAGIGQVTLRNWELGYCLPRMEVLIQAAAPFGLKGWELYKLVEEEYARKKTSTPNGVRFDKANQGKENGNRRHRREGGI
jgi:hypothetical protein